MCAAASASPSSTPTQPNTATSSASAATSATNTATISAPRTSRTRTANPEIERRSLPSETPPRFLRNKGDDRSRHTSGHSSSDSTNNNTGQSSPVHYLPSAALNPPGIPSGGPRPGRGVGPPQGQRPDYGRYSGSNMRGNGGYNNSSNSYYRGSQGEYNGDMNYRRGYESSGRNFEQGGRGYGRGMDHRGRGRSRGYSGDFNYRNQRGRGNAHQYMPQADRYYHDQMQVQPMVNYGQMEPHPSIPVAEIMPPGQYVAPPPLMSVNPMSGMQQPLDHMQSEQEKVLECASAASGEMLAEERSQEEAAAAQAERESPPGAQEGQQEACIPLADIDAPSLENNLEVVDILPLETSIPLPTATHGIMSEMGPGVPLQSPEMQNYFQVQVSTLEVEAVFL